MLASIVKHSTILTSGAKIITAGVIFGYGGKVLNNYLTSPFLKFTATVLNPFISITMTELVPYGIKYAAPLKDYIKPSDLGVGASVSITLATYQVINYLAEKTANATGLVTEANDSKIDLTPSASIFTKYLARGLCNTYTMNKSTLRNDGLKNFDDLKCAFLGEAVSGVVSMVLKADFNNDTQSILDSFHPKMLFWKSFSSSTWMTYVAHNKVLNQMETGSLLRNYVHSVFSDFTKIFYKPEISTSLLTALKLEQVITLVDSIKAKFTYCPPEINFKKIDKNYINQTNEHTIQDQLLHHNVFDMELSSPTNPTVFNFFADLEHEKCILSEIGKMSIIYPSDSQIHFFNLFAASEDKQCMLGEIDELSALYPLDPQIIEYNTTTHYVEPTD